jgi:hypothetical protein
MPRVNGQSLERYHILEQLGEDGNLIASKTRITHLAHDTTVKIKLFS